jgi:hypothetical protein
MQPRTLMLHTRLGAVEARTQPLERLPGRRGGCRRDTFRGHVELGVAEDLHHDPRVYVQVHEQRCAGAPGIVHGDLPDTG